VREWVGSGVRKWVQEAERLGEGERERERERERESLLGTIFYNGGSRARHGDKLITIRISSAIEEGHRTRDELVRERGSISRCF